MSLVIVSVGSLRNSSHVQFLSLSTSPVIEKVQLVSAVRGVGPADNTGKSLTRYWPGGRRPAGAWPRARPWKAREMKVMNEAPPSQLRSAHGMTITRPPHPPSEFDCDPPLW